MKMRRFFRKSAHEDKDSQESATVEPTESTEPTEEPGAPEEVVEVKAPPVPAGDEPNANGMRAAFAGVAAAVDVEVESLRRSLAVLQRTMDRAVDGEKEVRTAAVDGVQRELSSRIDEVVSGREKVANELKQSAEQERERVDGRLDEVKAAIEQSVNAKLEKLSGEFDALGKNLHAFQLELQRQAETSQKVTALLSNMAGVFSVKKAQPSLAPGGAAQPTVTASADSAEPCARTEVEDALERVFK